MKKKIFFQICRGGRNSSTTQLLSIVACHTLQGGNLRGVGGSNPGAMVDPIWKCAKNETGVRIG